MGRASARPAGRPRPSNGRLRPAAARGDEGFSLVEVIVSVGLIAAVMAALGTVTTGSLVTTSGQSGRQAAMQLAIDGLERVRALPVTTVDDIIEPTTPAAKTAVGLADTTRAVAGITYTQSWRITTCRHTSGGDCTGTGSAALEFLRVTVTVNWTEKGCPNSACAYTAHTLITRNITNPLFGDAYGDPPVLSTVVDRSTVEGTAITPVTVTVTDGVAPYSWSAVGLPPNLTIANGQISGTLSNTAADESPYSVVVTVRDRFLRETTTAPFTWTVTVPTLTLAAVANRSSAVGQAVTQTMTRGGGRAPYTFSTTTTLPPGLSISASTGTISGTPTTTGTTSITVRVIDSSPTPQSATTTFSWTRTAALPLAIATPPNQTSDNDINITPYQLTITGGAGAGPYTFSHNLPNGLSINSNGVISGRALSVGTYNDRRITVTDSLGNTASTDYFRWRVNN